MTGLVTIDLALGCLSLGLALGLWQHHRRWIPILLLIAGLGWLVDVVIVLVAQG